MKVIERTWSVAGNVYKNKFQTEIDAMVDANENFLYKQKHWEEGQWYPIGIRKLNWEWQPGNFFN